MVDAEFIPAPVRRELLLHLERAPLSDEQKNALTGQIPLGRLGQPGDIASAVAYLASPQAGYVTGQELHVNGGMYMA